jgi:hypothetical protein
MEALGSFRAGLLDGAAEPSTSRAHQPAQIQNNGEPNLFASAGKRVDGDMGQLHEYQVRFTDREGAFIDGETFFAVSIVDAATRAEEIKTEMCAASFVITSKGDTVWQERR